MERWLWTQKQDIGPTPRLYHRMAYDSARQRALLFGGSLLHEAGTEEFWWTGLNDTWEWDGEVWTQVADTGPAPQHSHSMVYDSVRQRIVLFAGQADGPNASSETWEWDGEAWTQVADTGPGREDHQAAYDSARQRVVLFRRGDTWEWDGEAWTQVADTGPGSRIFHAMAYDSERQRVVLFGGFWSVLLNDTWEWDGQKWTQVADTGPEPRSGHSMVQMGRRTVLFGGRLVGRAWSADTWEWDGKLWTKRQNMGPAKRSGHAMACDSNRERVVLYGGSVVNDPVVMPHVFGDTWELAIS